MIAAVADLTLTIQILGPYQAYYFSVSYSAQEEMGDHCGGDDFVSSNY